MLKHQAEIADEVGCDSTDKSLRVSGNSEDLPDYQKLDANHLTDFTVRTGEVSFPDETRSTPKQQAEVGKALGVTQRTVSRDVETNVSKQPEKPAYEATDRIRLITEDLQIRNPGRTLPFPR